MKALVEKFRAIGQSEGTNSGATEYVDAYHQAQADGRAKLDAGEWTSFTIEKRYRLEEVGSAPKD